MIEIMDRYCLSESVESLSYSHQLNEKSGSSINNYFENFNSNRRMNSSTSSLTSPVDSGVVLFDDVDLPSEMKNLSLEPNAVEAHVCEIQNVIEDTVSLNRTESTLSADPDILDQEVDDQIVFQRRTRKKVLKDSSAKCKRVSFHEDVDTGDKQRVVKDIKVSYGVSEKVSKDLFDGTPELAQDLNSSLTVCSDPSDVSFSIEKMFSKLKNQLLVPLVERGVPEGQEDPFHSSCVESNSSFFSPSKPVTPVKPVEIEQASCLKNSSVRNVLSETPSKAPLVNRFLQSLQMKHFRRKLASQQRRYQLKGLRSNKPLLVKTRNIEIDIQQQNQILNELNDEISINLCSQAETCWYKDVEAKLKNCLFKDVPIIVHKMFQVLSTTGEPLLAILTDSSVIIIAVNNSEFSIEFSVKYNNIKIVIVGPNNLTVMFVEQDSLRPSHFTIVTDNENLNGGNDLMSHLEIAVWRYKCNPLAVHSYSLHEDRTFLKKTAIELNEESLFCQWVWLQQTVISDLYPLGPTKEGYLMFKQSKRSRWIPSFILLKAGVIYVFVDSNLKLPIHAVYLQTKKFKGSRSCCDPCQPHGFEILFEPDISVKFGASCKEDVGEWLDAIAMSTFWVEDYQIAKKRQLDPVIGCCLLVTSKHIVMYQLPCEVLSCLPLQSLTVVKFSASHSYCILEFDCCEANETNGDWVVHFSSDDVLNKFYNMLSSVLPNLDQITASIDVTDDFTIRCMERNNSLKNVWARFL